MSGRYWDQRLETLPVERRRLLRDHRLRWQVRRCWDGSPFYRARLEAAGIDPASFGGLDDLAHLPIFRADDLPALGPDQPDPAWSVAPREWWSDVSHDGPRLVRTVTDGDAVHQTDLAARAIWAAGGRPGRTMTISGTGDGDEVADIVGAGATRIGMNAADAGTEASFIAGERVRALIGDDDDGSAGLSWWFVSPTVPYDEQSNGTALALWHVAPTVAYHCGAAEGVHWSDDHFLIEVVDPATGAAVELGDVGALVITDLTREGSPLLRFLTDLETALIDDTCPCGRTSVRSTVVRPRTFD